MTAHLPVKFGFACANAVAPTKTRAVAMSEDERRMRVTPGRVAARDGWLPSDANLPMGPGCGYGVTTEEYGRFRLTDSRKIENPFVCFQEGRAGAAVALPALWRIGSARTLDQDPRALPGVRPGPGAR